MGCLLQRCVHGASVNTASNRYNEDGMNTWALGLSLENMTLRFNKVVIPKYSFNCFSFRDQEKLSEIPHLYFLKL